MGKNNFLDFRDFDDFFVKGFGVPRSVIFNVAGTKDLMPACWKDYLDEDGKKVGYKAICRTVGINEKDVKVELKEDENSLLISGESIYEGEVYNTKFELGIAEDVMRNILDIKYKTLNGLTYIYLRTKVPDKKEIKIQRI